MFSSTVSLAIEPKIQMKFLVHSIQDLSQQIDEWCGIPAEFQLLVPNGKGCFNLTINLNSPGQDATDHTKSPYAQAEGYGGLLPNRNNNNQKKTGSKDDGTEAAHILSYEVMNELGRTYQKKFKFTRELENLYSLLMGDTKNLRIKTKNGNTNDRKLDKEIIDCLKIMNQSKLGMNTNMFKAAAKAMSSEAYKRLERVCKIIEVLFIPMSEINRSGGDFVSFLEDSLKRLGHIVNKRQAI